MEQKKAKIIVGMSGGVDSSVCAWLLKQQGYDVEGVFMKNWDEDDGTKYCTAKQDYHDALAVCDHINIPLHQVNFAAEYWDQVFKNFLEEYQKGRTPNPDILCNKEIKFKAFLEYAKWLGADKIATGHYARIQHNNTDYQLVKALDPKKDQTYFLYTLTQAVLQQVCFPIGDYEKQEIRILAQKNKIPTHNKKDSTGICFIGERNFRHFLSQYLPAQPGEIRDLDSNILLGEHNGLMYYTIGQRRGIGIGGVHNTDNEAWYVAKKDLQNNILWVVQGYNHTQLFAQGLSASQLHWISNHSPQRQILQAKIRYNQPPQKCLLETTADQSKIKVIFDKPQRAVTPGQSIVFYDDQICLGGGIIEHEYSNIQ